MELADLLDHIDASELATPPAPPIFQGGVIEAEWWREFFDGSGEELWARLVERVGVHQVPHAPVTRQAWEALLGREKIRRAQRLWSLDRHDDGTMRPEPERQELRRLDFQACKGDIWHWFHEYGWTALHYHQPRDRKPTSLDQLPMSLGGEMARIFR